MKFWFTLFTRCMPLWLIAAGVCAFFWPDAFIVFKPCLNSLFFCTMMGIGAVLRYEDFRPVFERPSAVALGMLAQFTIMPLLGFGLGCLLDLPDTVKLGLILVGCVPGAMASNVIAYLAKTDVAYSIALTSLATLLSPLLTPALTRLYARAIIRVDFWDMFRDICVIVILPLVIGCTLRRFFERQINRISYVFPALSTLCITIICALVVAINRGTLLKVTLLLFAAVFLQNMLGMILGYGAGRLYRFDRRRTRTLAIEVGMQNAGLGTVLALNQFSAETALVPAVFATWCVITASVLAEVWTVLGRRGMSKMS